MKKILPAVVCIFFAYVCKGQEPSLKDYKKKDSLRVEGNPLDRKEFYNYYLPTSLAKIDFAPGIISNLSIDFGDDEIIFKAGDAFKKTKDETNLKSTSDKSFSNSWFAGVGINASDGSAKILSGGKFNTGYSVKGGISIKTTDRRWYYKGNPDSTSSRQFAWINVVGKLNWKKYNIFQNDSTYKKETPVGFQVVAFYSNYFHSSIPKYHITNSVYSIGLGGGRFNNYTLLDDEFSLLEGVSLSNGSFKKTDEIEGKKGELRSFLAAVYSFDYFKSIIRSEKATLYIGARANGFLGHYGNINTSIGLYFSGTEVNNKNEKSEKYGFIIAGNLPNTQKFDWNSYLKKKAYISFSAVIPLKFSL